jgi:CRISPR-associated protein Cas1
VKNYYVLSNGRIKREANTVYIETADGARKPLPVEDIASIYVYGEVDLNTRLLNFLSQKRIPLHVFNYYGFYSGSYYPREYLHSGYLVVQQVQHYADPTRRMTLAREFVRGAAHSILRNVAYYSRRRVDGAQTDETEAEQTPADDLLEAAIDSAPTAIVDTSPAPEIDPYESAIEFDDTAGTLGDLRAAIGGIVAQIDSQVAVPELMGIEGKMRERYYRAWPHILTGEWAFDRRVRRPPDNEVNALISFGNGVIYTACLGELYRTQLTPTISYLHEPGARRFSLALDLAEIFKPLLVDRAIFRLLNTGQLTAKHFDTTLHGCTLTDAGKRLYLAALDERLGTTIMHRRLGRHVSYRHLIRLECYKLIRHLSGLEPYKAFRAWW